MSVLQSVKNLFRTSGSSESGTKPQGNYWCDDCEVKLLSTEAESDTPSCPDCGESMRFERSMDGIHCC